MCRGERAAGTAAPAIASTATWRDGHASNSKRPHESVWQHSVWSDWGVSEWLSGRRAGTFARVSPLRRCSRTACGRAAVATLTYIYADSTAVVGPLATYAEPHSYDLCEDHAAKLTAPRGWEVLRLDVDAGAVTPNSDDLEALANAVREAARPAAAPDAATFVETGRRGHLRVLKTEP